MSFLNPTLFPFYNVANVQNLYNFYPFTGNVTLDTQNVSSGSYTSPYGIYEPVYIFSPAIQLGVSSGNESFFNTTLSAETNIEESNATAVTSQIETQQNVLKANPLDVQGILTGAFQSTLPPNNNIEENRFKEGFKINDNSSCKAKESKLNILAKPFIPSWERDGGDNSFSQNFNSAISNNSQESSGFERLNNQHMPYHSPAYNEREEIQSHFVGVTDSYKGSLVQNLPKKQQTKSKRSSMAKQAQAQDRCAVVYNNNNCMERLAFAASSKKIKEQRKLKRPQIQIGSVQPNSFAADSNRPLGTNGAVYHNPQVQLAQQSPIYQQNDLTSVQVQNQNDSATYNQNQINCAPLWVQKPQETITYQQPNQYDNSLNTYQNQPSLLGTPPQNPVSCDAAGNIIQIPQDFATVQYQNQGYTVYQYQDHLTNDATQCQSTQANVPYQLPNQSDSTTAQVQNQLRVPLNYQNPPAYTAYQYLEQYDGSIYPYQYQVNSETQYQNPYENSSTQHQYDNTFYQYHLTGGAYQYSTLPYYTQNLPENTAYSYQSLPGNQAYQYQNPYANAVYPYQYQLNGAAYQFQSPGNPAYYINQYDGTSYSYQYCANTYPPIYLSGSPNVQLPDQTGDASNQNSITSYPDSEQSVPVPHENQILDGTMTTKHANFYDGNGDTVDSQLPFECNTMQPPPNGCGDAHLGENESCNFAKNVNDATPGNSPRRTAALEANKIFVNNLHESIDNRMLFKIFSKFGRIVQWNVAKDNLHRSEGHGFVHYETKEAAQAAIANANGMFLVNKRIGVDIFISRRQRERNRDRTRPPQLEYISPSGKHPDGLPPGKLYNTFFNVVVKNLPQNFTEHDLGTFFSPIGDIVQAKLMFAEKDGSHKIGYISYKDSAAAACAVEYLNGVVFLGREIVVKPAIDNFEPRGLLNNY